MSDNTPSSNPEPLPTLSGQRLALRMLNEQDIDDLYRVFSSPEGLRYWSWPPYTQRQQAVALYEDIIDCWQQQSLFQWGIEHLESGRIMGTTTLASLDRSNGRCEIGFILHPDYWRQGMISEALPLVINHAFGTLKMRRIEADVDPANEASLRTLERMGFQPEGLARERWQVNGEIQDSVMLGLLHHEWPPAA